MAHPAHRRPSRVIRFSYTPLYVATLAGVDATTNPYSPGAGRRPYALTGRDQEIGSWQTVLARVGSGRTDRSIILYGLRGVGKTVLLGEYRRLAEDAGWWVGQAEGGLGTDDFRGTLAKALYPVIREATQRGVGERMRAALATFKAFSVSVDTSGAWKFGVEVHPSTGRADTGNLETDLLELVADLGRAAQEQGRGIAILIDEMQELSPQALAALCAACHSAGQRELPFYVAGAGLSSLPRVLAEAKSYSERLFTYLPIGQLDPEAARRAIVEPSAAEGVAWEGDGVDHVVEAAGRYPYFLQEFGQQAWACAAGPSVVTVADARVGAADGLHRLDNGFFRSRWDRATPGERAYLTVMAVDGDGPSQAGEIAERLHRTVSSLGPTRAGLIAKGLAYSPEYGQVGFTVPGMADFINRQPEP